MSKTIRTPAQQLDTLAQKAGTPPVCQMAGGIALAWGRETEKRQLGFLMSTSGLNRNGWDLDQDGWRLGNFRNNPLLLWMHDPETVIGNWPVVELASSGKTGKYLRGSASFMPADPKLYELGQKAEMFYNMYLQSFLKAVSVRWRPLKFEPIPDEEFEEAGEPTPWFGGIRFTEMELLECSAVSIPGEPRALILACQSGLIPQTSVGLFVANKESMLSHNGEPVFDLDIAAPIEVETNPIVDMGASIVIESDFAVAHTAKSLLSDLRRTTQVETQSVQTDDDFSNAAVGYGEHGDCQRADREAEWDSAVARKRIAAWASSDGSGAKDKIDRKKYRKAFLYAPENENAMARFIGLHHDISGGKLTANFRGVKACAQRIQQGSFDVPEVDIASMKTHLEREYARFGEKPPWKNANGLVYEQLHEAILNADEAEDTTALREMCERLADELYGNDRLRELWESRRMPEGGDVTAWATAVEILEDAVGVEVVEDDERDARVDTLLYRLAEAFCPIEERMQRYRNLLMTMCQNLGLEADGDIDEETESRLSALTGIPADGTPPAPNPATDEIAGDPEVTTKLERVKKKMSRKLREEVLSDAQALETGSDSIFDRIKKKYEVVK